MTTRVRVRVTGTVQGVGFRPFVYGVATRLGLSGAVGNDPRGVWIEAEGAPDAVAALLVAVREEAPPLAVVDDVIAEPVPVTGAAGFAIAESTASGAVATAVPPDTATCDDCLRELWDPADRRHRYPFINCTNCGPRFTIVTGIPYDRPLTTMAGFALCDACAREYHDPADRRFHAQPICCPACGPHLQLVIAGQDRGDLAVPRFPLSGWGDSATRNGLGVGDELVGAAAGLLRDGAVVAVKGLGGYHLAAVADDAGAVGRLRARKHREDKPFAVMVADVAAARALAEVDAVAEAELTGSRRPIVLLPRREGAPVAQGVAPGAHELGVMLPYTPLHHLLLAAVGRPLVLTSGNVSDEPIAYRDDEARERLAGIADAFLVHDRPIHTRTDDSVVRVVRGAVQPLRRSRGYVPAPLRLPVAAARPVLAVGAELKSTFCLVRGHTAVVSHHIGDLENLETYRAFTEGIALLGRLVDVVPEVVAHDLHPEYLSTKYARELDGVELVGVQHHHAHIASCLADNDETGPVIGVAFDGLGYGTDGTLWGGEWLVADLHGFTRAGHLEAVPLPGGASAIRQPWRMAVAYLEAAGLGDAVLPIAERHAADWPRVRAVARSTLSPPTSSAGRLFDAVAALLDLRDEVTYEGQAAIELERAAPRTPLPAYPTVVVAGGRGFVVRGADLVAAVVEDLRDGVDTATIAGRFHAGVAGAIVAGCVRVRAATGLDLVALSGGVFQNVLLVSQVVPALEREGFRVLTHRRVPPNDGGISLGQAAVAAAGGWR